MSANGQKGIYEAIYEATDKLIKTFRELERIFVVLAGIKQKEEGTRQ